MPRPARHAAAWAALYLFWLVATRANQPTLPVAVVATGLLLGTAAVAVYADWYGLRGRVRAVRLGGLAAVMAGLTLATVSAIQAVYDLAGVPAAGRFGFWTNVGYEAAWYALHLTGAAVVRAVTRDTHGRR